MKIGNRTSKHATNVFSISVENKIEKEKKHTHTPHLCRKNRTRTHLVQTFITGKVRDQFKFRWLRRVFCFYEYDIEKRGIRKQKKTLKEEKIYRKILLSFHSSFFFSFSFYREWNKSLTVDFICSSRFEVEDCWRASTHTEHKPKMFASCFLKCLARLSDDFIIIVHCMSVIQKPNKFQYVSLTFSDCIAAIWSWSRIYSLISVCNAFIVYETHAHLHVGLRYWDWGWHLAMYLMWSWCVDIFNRNEIK